MPSTFDPYGFQDRAVSNYFIDKAQMLIDADPVLSAIGVRGGEFVQRWLSDHEVVGPRTIDAYAAWLPVALVRRRAMVGV